MLQRASLHVLFDLCTDEKVFLEYIAENSFGLHGLYIKKQLYQSIATSAKHTLILEVFVKLLICLFL